MIHSDIFYLFLIIALGYLLGNIKIKGFSLDISAILIIALMAGHFGITIPQGFKFFGLALFIYAVGLQAGPGFFETIKENGLKFNIIALFLLVIIFGLTFGVAIYLNIPKDVAEGIFTGAISSAPALAAALEIKNLPNISIAFGVVYPFAIIATIMFVRFLPSIVKANINQEKRDFEERQHCLHPDIITKNFKITNESFKNKTIHKSQIEKLTTTIIERVESKYPTDPSDEDAILHYGDIVRASGTEDQLDNLKIILGEEVEDTYTFHDDMKVFRLLVTNRDIVGKKIGEIKELKSLHAVITKVRRSGIDIPPYKSLTLLLGDKLYVVAPRKHEKKLIGLIGNDLLRYPAADFLPISFGIVIGIFVGSIPFSIPYLGTVKFSFVGGILITALILGRLGRTGKIVWQLSPHSNSLMKVLGQLIFLATIGTNSGKYLFESIKNHGWISVIIGLSAILLPLFLSTFIMRKLMKMNLFDIMGVLSGAMTSTPSLTMANNITASDYPSIGYAAVYPFAMVLSIILAQIGAKLI
ncbi:aspartate:alanine exchanger family transporter [Hippea maritima]|uniref:YidE/YbjL duplication n=1 Tax=Hippea maritima (strain ATCC 700847 / DSM 10411 / MH2) TaxID=760142 RepID=F2LTQ3_HIPMA|nr:aspartate:alanine exchanger family transporter [Hippea maritima]AEA34429.1 YidE/YbjL duplication [Hippea maritima DSM 10411]